MTSSVWDDDDPRGRAAALEAMDRIEEALWVVDPQTGEKYRMTPPCSLAPELWWPTVGQGRTDQTDFAKQMCQTCPAGPSATTSINPCRTYADIARETHGIWGGDSAAKIRRDRENRQRRRQAS